MKLNKIKLNELTKNSVANREMKELRGGRGCGCGCCYSDTGGSSTSANGAANNRSGYSSPDCFGEIYVTP